MAVGVCRHSKEMPALDLLMRQLALELGRSRPGPVAEP